MLFLKVKIKAKTVVINSSGANYYRVFIKKNGKWQTVKNTKGTSCVVSGLNGCTVYEFAVRPYYVNSSKKVIWAKTFSTVKARTKVAVINKFNL